MFTTTSCKDIGIIRNVVSGEQSNNILKYTNLEPGAARLLKVTPAVYPQLVLNAYFSHFSP